MEKLSAPNNSHLSTFPVLSSKEQNIILDRKVNDRFNNSLLADVSNEKHIVNREILMDLCRGDMKDLAAAKVDLTRKLSAGFIFWCDNYVWIQNPRADNAMDKNIPFLLYDFQERAAEEIIRAIMFGHDIPIEKSRDMGLSWLLISIFVYMWHFHGVDFLVGSQKKENVDMRGNIKTLIEKARYLTSRNPRWIMPELIDKKHDKSMLLIHPEHGATFAGESNNPNFGRSDRRKAILFDEFASWELTDKAAWQSCGSTTDCRIPLSTANTRGTNCHFFTVISNAKRKMLPFLRLHWTLHPMFAEGVSTDELGNPTSPWYERMKKKASSMAEVHQELDIDYDASMGSKIFPNFKIENNVRENITYNEALPLYISWDFGLDTTALLWWQEDKSTNTFYIIDEYQNNGAGAGTSIYHYIDIVQSKPYKQAIHYGDPHSGENHSLTSGQSNGSILRKYGFIFKSQRAPIKQRIAALKNLMDNIIVSDTCTILIEALGSWQFIKPKTGNTSSETPQHNEYSHIGDAATYFPINHKYKKTERGGTGRGRKNYSSSASGVVG